MPKKIQLNIPKPCHEDWDAMTPVDQGKFCGSCEKQVVDFSSMSDRQVAEFFKKPILNSSKDGSVCGRFMTDQLDRDLEIPKKRLPWLKYFFTIALPGFFVSLKAAGSKTQGQPIVRKVNADTTRKNIYDDVKMMGMVSRLQNIKPFVEDKVNKPIEKPVAKDTIPVCTKPVTGKPADMTLRGEVVVVAGGVSVRRDNEIMITGLIVNESNHPVPFARVEAAGKKMIYADKDGYFEITERKSRKSQKLLVTADGYVAREYNLNGTQPGSSKLRILLKKKAIEPVLRISPVNSIRVFPNPVLAGSGINIEWKQTEEGYYELELVNQSGQAVHQKEIWIDAEARLLNINLPVLPAAGYFLIITHKRSGKRFEEKLIIQ